MSQDAAYTIGNARYAKGKKAVRCPSSDGWKTRAARLAARLANDRYTNREQAYIMSPSAAVRFERLYAEGWDASVMTTDFILPDAEPRT
jgi:hypothetical protein